MTGREQLQQAPLLDCLVDAGEQLRRHLKAECLGRLHVDDELEFCCLDDRQISRLRSLQDLTGVNADLTIHVRNIASITHQPAHFDKLA